MTSSLSIDIWITSSPSVNLLITSPKTVSTQVTILYIASFITVGFAKETPNNPNAITPIINLLAFFTKENIKNIIAIPTTIITIGWKTSFHIGFVSKSVIISFIFNNNSGPNNNDVSDTAYLAIVMFKLPNVYG